MLITPINNINTNINTTIFKSRIPIKKQAAVKTAETALSVTAGFYLSLYGLKKSDSIKEIKDGNKIISIKLNPKGHEEYRTVYEPSQIAGEYNITQIYQNGDKKILSSAKINKSGHFDIQKDFVSPLGTRTSYKRHGMNDDYKMSYVIKDKFGNTKLDFNRSFKKLDNERTETAANGKRYINTFDYLGVASVNQDNPDDKNFMIVNWQFEDNMKNFPAEIFYCMGKNGIRMIEEDYGNEGNAFICGDLMRLSTKLRNDYFVMAHEIGHVRSFELGDLEKDENLQKIYEKERNEALQNLGNITINESEYLILNTKGLREVAAETYAILSGVDHNGIEAPTGIRADIIMQYLPNTIAHIANRMYN